MGNAVVHFEIVGWNGERLREFYRQLFDWKIDDRNPLDYGVVHREGNTTAGGVGIGGGVGSAMPGSQGHVTIYVEVPDVDAALRRVEHLGGTRLWGPMQVTDDIQIGQFEDPEGHLIGLSRTTQLAARLNDHLHQEQHKETAMSTAITTSTVTSTDGTTIEFDRLGDGPSVVIVGSGPTDRAANSPVAELLAPTFTVINYDRRGRGGSSDTAPFTIDREYEDLACVIEAAGGSAYVYGTSGGAHIAMEAAARGLGITKLGLWEPPYVLDDETSRPRPPADYEIQLAAAAAERPGDAVEMFFTVAAGLPAEFIAPMRDMPFWPAMEALAPALVHDAALMGDFRPPTEGLAKLSIPTLVVDGGTVPWISRSADRVADLVPGAQRRTIAGQPHNVDPTAIAQVLADFFAI